MSDSMEKLTGLINNFRSISATEAELISSYFDLKSFKETEYLFRGGRVCSNLYFVIDGVLRIVKINDKGRDITYYFIKEGQFCTLLESFDNGSIADDSIQASSPVMVLEINKRRLLKLYQNFPFMVDFINHINRQRLLDKIRLKNIFAGEDSTSRYNLFLTEQPDIAHRVPLNHVASYLNITSQSLSRIRKAVK
jgi:CRP-like cAMP-binding protein